MDRIITSSIPQLDGWMDYLNDTLGKVAPFRVVDAAKLTHVPRACLSQWCMVKGLYSITTTEMVDYFSKLIQGRKAIEICAGRGNLGAALQIPQVDSRPGAGTHVIAATVDEALESFEPQVVIGAWTDQKGTQDVPYSTPHGVDEEALISAVACYALVGNSHAHGLKRVLRHEHRQDHFDWLVSRSTYPKEDVIYQWGK